MQKLQNGIVVALLGFSGLVVQAADPIELDYVESTGKQWVDTGIVGKFGTKAEIRVEWVDIVSDSSMLACRGNDSTNTRINFLNAYNERIGFGYGTYNNASIAPFTCKWEKNRIYTVVSDFAATESGAKVNVTVDGIEVAKWDSEAQINTSCNLVIFGNNVAGTKTGLAKARCYGLKIWQDGDLVRDFVPVQVGSKVGFYDKVTKDYFYSATAEELKAGTSANEPDGFVDYVESTGGPYVDLDVKGKVGLSMSSRMSWVEVPEDAAYVAARKGSKDRFYLYYYYQSSTIAYGDYYQSGQKLTSGVVHDVYSVLKTNEQRLTIDGNDVLAKTDSASTDTGLNLYLFAINYDGAARYASKARCYSLKIWDGTTLVRDFRPCLKLGEACLYDEVSKRIFRASGGKLKAGRLSVKGRPDYFVEYLEVKGDNFLDTGVRAKSGVRAAGDFQYTQTRSADEEDKMYLEAPLDRKERTFLGACAADNSQRCYLLHAVGGDMWIGHGDHRVYPKNQGGDSVNFGTERHVFDVTLAANQQSASCDGIVLSLEGSPWTANVDAGCNLYLFGCNAGGTVRHQSNVRFYSLKLWQGESLERDFLPCVKNGQAGLYDAQNDEVVFPALFVDPSCLGAPVLTDDMKPVKVLEYVESDGSQWYDTGVTGCVGTVANIKMAWLEQGKDIGFLGSRKTSGDTRFYMWHNAYDKMSCGVEKFWYFNNADPTQPKDGSSGVETIPIEVGKTYQVNASFLPERQHITVNGKVVFDVLKTVDLDTDYPLYLFANDNMGEATGKSAARLYSLKIRQGGRIVRHFVPVRLDCGVNALYDMVEEKPYSPCGAQMRSWGPEIGDYTGRLGCAIIIR